MYVPGHFSLDDEAALALIERHPFALLLSGVAGGGMPAMHSHLPLIRSGGSLVGHLATANPHAVNLEGPAIAVFSGTHSYVSPRWYRSPTNVPTWNYEAVEVAGRVEIVRDREHAMQVVDLLVDAMEVGAWRVDWSEPPYNELLNHITVFNLRIEQLTGKCKMSQNKAPDDRDGVIRGLLDSGDPGSLAVAERMRSLDATSRRG